MKYGARNAIAGTVRSTKKGDVMSMIKIDVASPVELASVMTTESLEELAIAPGDKVKLIVKAIHVLVVKE
jgi:molybdopterin-binding protein